MNQSQEEFIENIIATALENAGYKITGRFSSQDSAPGNHGVSFTGKAGKWTLALDRDL